MTYRIRILAVLAATLSASLLSAPTAHAEDQRPCVSKAEYYGAKEYGTPLTRDPMTKVPQVPVETIGRLELEDKWDVRHGGVTMKYLLGDRPGTGGSLNSNPLIRVKMYRSCEEPLSDLQIYVGFHKDTNMVFWTLRWPTRLT